MRGMHFGVSLPGRGPLATPEILTKLAEKADALRYTSLFVTDHVVIPTANNSTYPYSPSGRFATDWTNGYLEPIAMMGVLVGLTSRIKLGTSVLVVPYRNPVVTAKMLATLDVMSGGRVDFGIGRGYRKAEFDQFCIPIAEADARTIVDVVGRALAQGFLPAAPDKGACRWCDFRPVCGPYEEIRIGKKPKDRLADLKMLRELP